MPNNEEESVDSNQISDIKSPIKLKKVLSDNLIDHISIDTSDKNQTSNANSPMKVGITHNDLLLNTNEYAVSEIVEKNACQSQNSVINSIQLPGKFKKFSVNLLEISDEFTNTVDENKKELSDTEQNSDLDSPIKFKKKFSRLSDNVLNDTDEHEVVSIVEDHIKSSSDSDQNSDTDSPIKLKKKKIKFFSNSLLDGTGKLESSSIVDPNEKKSLDQDETSDIDSPIKFEKRFRKFSADSLEDIDKLVISEHGDTDKLESCTVVDPYEKKSLDQDETSDIDSPIKLKKRFRKFSTDSLEDIDKLVISKHGDKESVDPYQTPDTDSSIINKTSSKDVSNEFKNFENEYADNETNNQSMEESFLNTENSNSLDDDSPIKKDRSGFIRDVKGKELMRQNLSLPYFQLPKPDFREYMNETDKRLEEPLLKIEPNSSQKAKLSNKITLKPTDNIVFEIGPPRMDKVEPFRKKVLNMMSRCNGLKSNSADKTAGYQKSIPKPIGAERLSWKMKLLNDIAKKKEAALKERNEMLEEALEVNEEYQNEESETEDLTEEDASNSNYPVSDTLVSAPGVDEQDDSLPDISAIYKDHPFDRNNVERACENDKEFESSPLCFSLPSFQPEGGFSKAVDQSSSIISNVSQSQVSLSFNESESQRENHSLSLFGSSDLLSSNPLPPISQSDEIVYHKVLAKENLLASKHDISRDMITADIVDICSGQFPDDEELPKTPPLINISADEDSEGDVSDSNCPTFQPLLEYDSDSEDDLKFKRKVLNKKIRPISPIDEESRYGEEDTHVHPASVLLEANSNFNFSKNESEKDSDSEDDNNADEVQQQNLNFDSEESLVDDSKEVHKAPKNVRDYFENEAELSGEEGSSDEDERDMDGEDPLILDDANLPANDELRDQIGSLHLKHLLDDDDQMIKKVKNHFLEEGELFSDAIRQRKFNWSFNQVEAVHNPNLSDSENEEEISETPFHGDKIKWMQENGNKENEDETDQSFDASFKLGVRKKIATQIVADRLSHSFSKRPRNSFLDEEEAKKSFKKMKLDVTNAQGSRVTKNFVFVEANENNAAKKKVSNPKNSIDSSVFDLI